MVNLMYQLGWVAVTRFWSNILLDVSVKVFFFVVFCFNDFNIEVSGLCGKQVTLHNMGEPHPISSRP